MEKYSLIDEDINEKVEANMAIFILLFIVLIICGLGAIHHEVRYKNRNDQRIIMRMDEVIKELKILNSKEINKTEVTNEHSPVE